MVQMNSQYAVLSTIHQVEGFDPAAFAVEYTDLTTNEKRVRIPVMVQMAWFRLKYPEGKIAISVEQTHSCFVATARVYVSYKDPVDWYLSEATASRSYDDTKPTVSPREWAQTAAIGIALRNAGFGVQFHAAGDDFDSPAAVELDVTELPPAPKQRTEPSAEPREEPQKPVQLTPEEQFKQACDMMCPLSKYNGKTLGDVLQTDPGAINWIANKFSRDPQIQAAAKFICEYSIQQASA